MNELNLLPSWALHHYLAAAPSALLPRCTFRLYIRFRCHVWLSSSLLRAGGSISALHVHRPESKAQAAIALNTLTLANEANQFTVAQGLVRIMQLGSSEAQEEARSILQSTIYNLRTHNGKANPHGPSDMYMSREAKKNDNGWYDLDTI